MCDKTLVYPLKLIFKAFIQEGVFLDCWKKANVVPIHKKESKNLLKIYRPISLLPIFGKIYERIILKELFNHFHQNNFLQNVGLVFSLVIDVFCSYCLLSTK